MSKKNRQRAQRLPLNANLPPPLEAGVVNTVVAEVVEPGKPFTVGIGERMAADPAFKTITVAPAPQPAERSGVFGGYPQATEQWWAGVKGTAV